MPTFVVLGHRYPWIDLTYIQKGAYGEEVLSFLGCVHPLYDYCSDALIIEGRDIVHRAEDAVVGNDNQHVCCNCGIIRYSTPAMINPRCHMKNARPSKSASRGDSGNQIGVNHYAWMCLPNTNRSCPKT